MKELRSIPILPNELQEVEFGYIKLKLKSYLDSHNITRNALSKKTGVKYQTIDKYYKSITVDRADLTLLAKICYVLKCEIIDLLEYSETNMEN